MRLTQMAGTPREAGVVRFVGHPWHSHPEPQVIYVAVGTGRVLVPGREHELAAGDAVWLPARCQHAVELAPDGILLGPLLSANSGPPGGTPRTLRAHPGLPPLMITLLGVAPDRDEEIRHFRRAIEDLLAASLPGWFGLPAPAHREAARIADSCVDSSETLEQLARRHFVSARQIRRVFLAQTRMSFAQWRTRARLNIAIDLLIRGATPRVAAEAASFTTREGLLKALARECRIPADQLAADPGGGPHSGASIPPGAVTDTSSPLDRLAKSAGVITRTGTRMA